MLTHDEYEGKWKHEQRQSYRLSKEVADMSKENKWLLDSVQNLSDEDKLAYQLLFKRFPLRPIRNMKENRRAMTLADELLVRRADLSSVERDYLEILTDLIHKFEGSAFAGDEIEIAPHELVRSLLEVQAIKQADLAKELDIAPSRLSEFLSGKRKASISLAKKLARRFALSLDQLMKDVEQQKPKAGSVAETSCSNADYLIDMHVTWKPSEAAYEKIKAAAAAAGVSFQAYIKMVAYQAAMRDQQSL